MTGEKQRKWTRKKGNEKGQREKVKEVIREKEKEVRRGKGRDKEKGKDEML